MTPKQTAMYWAEWGKLRDILRGRGKSLTQIDDYRHALTRRALGVDKSSKAFTNRDLDAVLARIRAECEPANLDAQLEIQESPERRRAHVIERCIEVCGDMFAHGGDCRLSTHDKCAAYVRGTTRNVIKKEVDECTAEEMAKVLGCLTQRLNRLVRDAKARATAAGYVAPVARADEEDGNPF